MNPNLKRASWLELFYDVAFVALVAQLTYLTYEHHATLSDWLNTFIIGYAIFIAWWATTANRNLKPNETTADKISIQIQMVGAFFMSISMPAVFAGSYVGFFVTLAIVRLIQAAMVARMYITHPETRPVTYNILEGFVIGGLLWLVSAFLLAPFHFVAAGMALAVEILTPLTKGKGNTTRYLNVYHLQERLGLFMMLVIGESMIVVALSNTAASLSVVEPTIIVSGLGMMIALWWLYFEDGDRQQGVRPRNLFYFLHAHGFLFGSIILLSVGYKLAITHHDSLEAGAFVALGSLGVVISLAVIRYMMHGNKNTLLIASALCITSIFAVAGWGIIFSQATTMVLLLTTMFLLLAVVDFKYALFKAPVQSSQE